MLHVHTPTCILFSKHMYGKTIQQTQMYTSLILYHISSSPKRPITGMCRVQH